MSLEILLIPAAMAAYSAWQARAEAGTNNCLVETRWRHTGLLAQALNDLGADAVRGTADEVSATVGGMTATFTRGADGILTAHFPKDSDVDRAMVVINQIDSAYTRRVQDVVYSRVQQRVSELGYEVESATVDEDETITLVVNLD